MLPRICSLMGFERYEHRDRVNDDEPPIVSAVAPGHASIAVGNASTGVTVYPGSTLPAGTVQWSIPGDASETVQILPTVPRVPGGADVFAQRSGTVQAITASGAVAWTANLASPCSSGEFPLPLCLPHFSGGLIVMNNQRDLIERFDGITGQSSTIYPFTQPPILFRRIRDTYFAARRCSFFRMARS